MKDLRELHTKGVAFVPYASELKAEVAELLEAWRNFIALPQAVKDQLLADERTGWLGYEMKHGAGKNVDKKENFDISPLFHPDLANLDTLARQFVKQASSLSQHMSTRVLRLIASIAEEFDLPKLAGVRAGDIETIVRFLHYPGGREVGGVIGEPHVDQSGLTLHLAETSDGCERLDFDTKEWVPMPVSSEHGITFAAMQLQLLSEGNIRGLCHRIVANKESAKDGRLAIVCFTRFVGDTPQYDKKTHGRSQEFTPGYNYDMSLEEFAKLFTSA